MPVIALVAAALAEDLAVVPAPRAVELLVGEALVEASSGGHRPQFAVVVGGHFPVRGRLGVAAEVLGSVGGERSDVLALDQWLVRPAALATVTFARPPTVVTRRGRERPTAWLAFDAGVGPALSLTITRWIAPDLGAVTLPEPAIRGRAGLTLGVGDHLRVRGQGGLAVRLTGVDHDYTLGAAWAW